MYSILLVDDQPAILAGLTTLVEDTGIAHVVATETEGGAAVETALAQKPDLIILDVSLGGESGVNVARNLFSRWPEARVLAVSAHADSVYVRGMLKVGVSGYMLKDNGPSEIADAIATIMTGDQWIGQGLEFSPA